MPNILAGIMYGLFFYLLANRLFSNNKWIFWIFLLCAFANPYLIQFFSLARGYGLSVGFLLASLYFLVTADKLNNKYWISVLLGALGVYANLTLLNYFVPLSCLILYNLIKDKNYTQIKLCLLIVGILSAILYLPITKMIRTDQFHFWGNSGFYTDTIIPSVDAALMHNQYLGSKTLIIFSRLIFLVTSTLALVSIFKIVKRKSIEGYEIPILFVGAIVYNLIQFYLFKIPFLNARTSLFYFPLFIISFFVLYNKAFAQFKPYSIYLLSMLAGCCILHITRSYNVKSSFEWWFDANNKQVIEIIRKDQLNLKIADHSSFKCNWIFQPSFAYYTLDRKVNIINSPPYNKNLDSTELVDYYYITSDDKCNWISTNYVELASFDWNTRFLMKKK